MASAVGKRRERRGGRKEGVTTIWILGDQLSAEHAALVRFRPGEARVLMVESKARGSVLRYHQLKLVLVYSAMRHFADDLRAAGWEVDYYPLERALTFPAAAREHLAMHRPERLLLAEPNSFMETDALAQLARKLRVPLEWVPTAQFLVPREEFQKWAGGSSRLLMENHYRRVRKLHGWLIDGHGEPVGGAWNFDAENRETHAAWQRAGAPRGGPPVEKPDAITRDVIALVAREFSDHPGDAKKFWLPVDRRGARRWLRAFIADRLPRFGAFEDMMAEGEPFLFHSVLSPLLNLGLLAPRECIEAALAAFQKGDAPLNSVEGFIRQIAGWREFINGVYWLRGPEYKQLNALGAERPLPTWIYTGETRLNCLHHVVRQTLDLGWNHHIQRLMIIGNFLLLAGVRPQETLRWFNEMYVDAYDWVMAPNVVGMSQHADGGFMATKPYISSSGYIQKMSDYCRGCAFDPGEKTGPRACPFNYLYWNFIDLHAHRFAKNPRMSALVAGWWKRSEPDKNKVRESAARFLAEEFGHGLAASAD